MKKVYIAGPYTHGDVAENVRNAVLAGEELADLGFAPFIPHLTHFWHYLSPRPYKFWLDLDREFLECCDCVLRLPGLSSGADEEVRRATELGITVFFYLETLKSHYGMGEKAAQLGSGKN